MPPPTHDTPAPDKPIAVPNAAKPIPPVPKIKRPAKRPVTAPAATPVNAPIAPITTVSGWKKETTMCATNTTINVQKTMLKNVAITSPNY